MSARVSIWFESDPVFGPKLTAAKLAALDVSIRAGGFRQPLDRSVREVLIPAIEHQFDVGGDPKWKDTKAITKLNRIRRGNSPTPVLVETGKLKKAATAIGRWRVRDDEAIFTGLPGHAYYGTYHLTGTMRNNMPIRDWARWDQGTESKCADIFDTWLDDKIKSSTKRVL